MASRYNSVYFFQHSLMNLPFSNINSIIHPNAENIPFTLLHFASAMYYNNQYWEDTDRVKADLQLESHYNDYINSYISYISMVRTIYSLFAEGITYLYDIHFCTILIISTICRYVCCLLFPTFIVIYCFIVILYKF